MIRWSNHVTKVSIPVGACPSKRFGNDYGKSENWIVLKTPSEHNEVGFVFLEYWWYYTILTVLVVLYLPF